MGMADAGRRGKKPLLVWTMENAISQSQGPAISRRQTLVRQPLRGFLAIPAVCQKCVELGIDDDPPSLHGSVRGPAYRKEVRPAPRFWPTFSYTKIPMPRRRKRGRPRTGSKPVVPVRLDVKQLKKIAKLAELEGVDRTTVLRKLIDIGLDSPQVSLLMRRPGTKGQSEVERVIRVVAAHERVKVTQSAVMRAPSVETEVRKLPLHPLCGCLP
jgi:hypothetical protein